MNINEYESENWPLPRFRHAPDGMRFEPITGGWIPAPDALDVACAYDEAIKRIVAMQAAFQAIKDHANRNVNHDEADAILKIIDNILET